MTHARVGNRGRQRSQMFALSVLVIGLVATALMGAWVRHQNQELVRAELATLAGSIRANVQERLSSYETLLFAGRSALTFRPDGPVFQKDWLRFAEGLDLHAHYPGIDGFVYVARVPHGDLPALEQQIGRPAFPARAPAPALAPAPDDQGDHYVLTAFAPAPRAARALGFDLSSDSLRRETLERARDTNSPQLTEPLHLITRDGVRKTDFLHYLPVYRSDAPVSTVAQRREALTGWISAGYAADEVLLAPLQRAGTLATVEVFAGPDPTLGKLMLRYAPSGGGAETVPGALALRTIKTVGAGGRVWALRFTATPALEARADSTDETLVLLSGLLASLGLAGMVWSLVRHWCEAEATSRGALRNLQETEARYETLVETAAIGIARCTADGRLVSINDAFAAQMCSSRDNLLGRAWMILLNPAEQNAFLTGAGAVARGERETLRMEFGCKNGIGQDVWLDFVVSASGSEDAKDKGSRLLTLMVQDISNRKETESALRTANTWLETLLDATPAGLVLLTPQRRIRLANRHLCEMLRLGPEEVTGLCSDTFLPSRSVVRTLTRASADVMRQGTIFEREMELLRWDGTRFWARVVGRALDAGDLSKGTLWAVIDLSDLKRAGEMLEAARAELDAILSTAPSVAFVRIPGAPHFQFVSASVCAILGWTPEDITANPAWWDGARHPDDAACPCMSISTPPAPGLLERLCRLRHRDGHWVWILERINPQFAPDGTLTRLVGVWVDLSEQKKLEAALVARTNELSRSNAELEAFAYVASHDLRQPLRMVTGYLGLLAKSLPDLDQTKREWMYLARDGAKRMDRLIVDLLEYSRLGRRGRGFEVLDMGEVVSTALLNLQSQIEECHAEISTPDVWPQLNGVFNDLMRLVQNLMSNALTYRAPERSPRITLSVVQVGENWEFTVADNGIGIPASDSERIFGLFQRLHAAGTYEGTGIGLAVCKKVVEHHQGHIRVESTVGEGSRFIFTLPVLPS